MVRKLVRLLLTLIGAALGPTLVIAVSNELVSMGYMGIQDVLVPWAVMLIYAASGIILGIISYALCPKLIDLFTSVVGYAESKLSEMALADIFFGVMGLILGLVIVFLLSTLTAAITMHCLKLIINIVLYILLGYLGWSVVVKRKGEIVAPNWFKRGKENVGKTSLMARSKILDTSVIIDGRIADICRTGIVEGDLIVPDFVLQELRHIADSADSLKRNRGRRGLDILNLMQNEMNIPITVSNVDYEDIAEVDAKLIKLAFDMGGVVVTNDYNLNKVAGVQRVPVFNINELANAMKAVVLPGEEMDVAVVKEGKESGQGVAYLDDGTMIVIDGGKKFVGGEITVIVTSVLQTSAGRMIFARVK